jgi:lysylphosphatidylglycerol synthetase-like protein (DUF2156 family)
MNTLMSGKTILNKLLAIFIIGALALSPIMSLELQANPNSGNSPQPPTGNEREKTNTNNLTEDRPGPGTIPVGSGVFESTNLVSTVSLVIRWALGFVGVVVFVIFLLAGFEYATAGGDEAKASTATKRMVNAIIGLIIIFFAFVISNTVLSFIFGTGTGN